MAMLQTVSKRSLDEWCHRFSFGAKNVWLGYAIRNFRPGVTADSRTQPGLPSGWGCRARRPFRERDKLFVSGERPGAGGIGIRAPCEVLAGSLGGQALVRPTP